MPQLPQRVNDVSPCMSPLPAGRDRTAGFSSCGKDIDESLASRRHKCVDRVPARPHRRDTGGCAAAEQQQHRHRPRFVDRIRAVARSTASQPLRSHRQRGHSSRCTGVGWHAKCTDRNDGSAASFGASVTGERRHNGIHLTVGAGDIDTACWTLGDGWRVTRHGPVSRVNAMSV